MHCADKYYSEDLKYFVFVESRVVVVVAGMCT